MYPDVELSLEVANSEDIEASIHDTTLDIGLIEGPLIGKDLESIPFLTDHLQLVTSLDHRGPIWTPSLFLNWTNSRSSPAKKVPVPVRKSSSI